MVGSEVRCQCLPLVLSRFRDVHLTSTGCDVKEVPEAPRRPKLKCVKSKTDIVVDLYVIANRFRVDAADLSASLRFFAGGQTDRERITVITG